MWFLIIELIKGYTLHFGPHWILFVAKLGMVRAPKIKRLRHIFSIIICMIYQTTKIIGY